MDVRRGRRPLDARRFVDEAPRRAADRTVNYFGPVADVRVTIRVADGAWRVAANDLCHGCAKRQCHRVGMRVVAATAPGHGASAPATPLDRPAERGGRWLRLPRAQLRSQDCARRWPPPIAPAARALPSAWGGRRDRPLTLASRTRWRRGGGLRCPTRRRRGGTSRLRYAAHRERPTGIGRSARSALVRPSGRCPRPGAGRMPAARARRARSPIRLH